jgi:hypothetical protein
MKHSLTFSKKKYRLDFTGRFWIRWNYGPLDSNDRHQKSAVRLRFAYKLQNQPYWAEVLATYNQSNGSATPV